MRILFLLASSLFFSFASFSQEEKSIQISPEVHFRTFWMSTSYPQDFKNDYALGSSLSLGGKMTFAEKWTFQVGYRMFGNVASSSIWESDPLTGQSNRYETGLFDLLTPGDDFFGKLELLNLAYSGEKWGAKIGRFGINTPWINPQDGRLSPTGVEGIEAWLSPSENWKLKAWWIHQMSVRGSSEWLGVGQSIGVFPVGRDVFAQPSRYAGNTESGFIGIFQAEFKSERLGRFEFTETFVQNISNTLTLTWNDFWQGPGSDSQWLGGLQLGLQHGVGYGGNELESLRYKDPEDVNASLSAKFGFKSKRWLTHLNFTRLGGTGRWLSPREWGRDPFFTFIPRERNEGFESVTAATWFVSYSPESLPLEFYTHLGMHRLPDTSDAEANKYNFPSYRQTNFGVKFSPEKLQKTNFHLLIMNKEALDAEGLAPGQRYNKLEMWHINLMVDFYLR